MHNEIEWFIISWSLPVIHIDHVDKEKEEKRKTNKLERFQYSKFWPKTIHS